MPINLKARKNTLSLICPYEHKLSNSCTHLQMRIRFQTEWQTALRVESLALSASSPKSPEYMICAFEQALYVQMAACKPE